MKAEFEEILSDYFLRAPMDKYIKYEDALKAMNEAWNLALTQAAEAAEVEFGSQDGWIREPVVDKQSILSLKIEEK